MKSIELSKAITAAMSLRLPGTVGKIANKMRYIDAKRPLFLEGGMIRKIEQGHFERLHTVGISSRSNSLPAFGGVLYGAVALRHDIFINNKHVVEGFQDSLIDVSDMNFLDANERLIWKEYILVYRLLEDLFEQGPLPDLVLIDLPLLVPRAEQSLSLAEPDIEEEWTELQKTMERFWRAHLDRCFPIQRDGPILLSLQSKRDMGAAVLNAVRLKGANGTPESISPDLINLISEEWIQLQQVGILRFLKGILRAGRRTSAYYYQALGRQMKRFEPRQVAEFGLIGFHLQVGLRTPIWKIETIGAPELWNSEHLDRVASLIAYTTLYDNPNAKPLALWFAQRLIQMTNMKPVLVNYMKETLALLRDQSVEQAWLEGLEIFEEGLE